MPLPVSVQIITLNEEGNIGPCLERVFVNDPAEVVVIDGGSTDRTVEIATRMGARVLAPGRLGRGDSRRLGYMSTELPYVAMVDSDDRIAHDWLAVSLRELQEGGYAGLQSSLRVLEARSWWERGWDQYYRESIQPTADTIMVGHPAIYLTSALRDGPEEVGHEGEDTQLSRDFVERGLRQGIGTAMSYRHCLPTRSENFKKWRGYGHGYAEFVHLHPERFGAIVKHIAWTVPVVRGWRPVARGHVMQPIFAAFMAGNIAIGFVERGGLRRG